MNPMDVVHNWLDTIEAKTQYFLAPEDLRFLNVQSLGGGIGCDRPTNYYNPGAVLCGAAASRTVRGRRSRAVLE